MSPDSPRPSKIRAAWRVMSALGVLLGAAAILLTAVKWSRTDDAIRAVQQSRVEACQQSNERHDNTVRVLDERIRQLPSAQRKRAEAGRAATVALIEALSPKRDCTKFVEPPD